MTAAPTAPGVIDLSWGQAIDNGTPILYYEIDYGQGFAPLSDNSTRTQITSLANGRTYSFGVRAVNEVGTSPMCASSSATTWDLPTPLGASLSFDAQTAELTASISGGASPSNPIISYEARFSIDGDPDGNATVLAGVSPPNTVLHVVIVDGSYRFEFEVCNAVGCVETETCCENIVLQAPPDQMDPPLLRFDNPAWDRFGVDVFANLTPPNDNGAPIEFYRLQTRLIDQHGTVTTQNFPDVTDLETLIDFYKGYSSYPRSKNGGVPLTWEARAAAENAEGQGLFSEWATISPNPRPPHVVVSPGGYQTCRPDWCARVVITLYGMGPNQTHLFDLEVVGQNRPDVVRCIEGQISANNNGHAVLEDTCVFDGGRWSTVQATVDGVVSNETQVDPE